MHPRASTSIRMHTYINILIFLINSFTFMLQERGGKIINYKCYSLLGESAVSKIAFAMYSRIDGIAR